MPNAIFASITAKGTCGGSVGEIENVYNGLFSVLYVTNYILKCTLERKKHVSQKQRPSRGVL